MESVEWNLESGVRRVEFGECSWESVVEECSLEGVVLESGVWRV